MKNLQKTIKAITRAGDEGGYVAECMEVAVVTQGKTLDEILRNLKEAVVLHLEGENPADFGLVDRPSLVVTMEVDPEYAKTA